MEDLRGKFSKAGTTSFSSAQVLSCPCPSASAGTLAASHQYPQVDVAHPTLPSTIGTYHSLSPWWPRNKMRMRRTLSNLPRTGRSCNVANDQSQHFSVATLWSLSRQWHHTVAMRWIHLVSPCAQVVSMKALY